MTWEWLWLGKADNITEKNFDQAVPNADIKELLIQAISSNTVGTISDSGATDKAMLKLMDRWGINVDEKRKLYYDEKNIVRFPFDSKRKRMSTVIDVKELSYPKRLHTKGASEIILQTCSHYLDQNGQKVAITD